MRIGIDARLVYYHQAGIGQYILRLAQALARIDHEDRFVLFTSRKDHTPITEQSNFRRQKLWTPSHHRFERLAMSAELFPFNMDVLHSPDFIPPSGARCPTVITVHDLAFLLYPRFLTRDSARYYGQVDQAARSADHIIAVSESTKRDTVRLLGVPEEKISVIYEAAHPLFTPITNEEAISRVRNRYHLPPTFILFVGTIEPRKNIPTLLRAFKRLRDNYKSTATLAIAGNRGWLVEEVDGVIEELKLGDAVRCLGGVPNEELVYLYNAARLFVLPSFYEGFGLTPLEAMACGTPVVVSNTSSLPEVVGDAGWLINPEDVEGLTVAMYRGLTDENLRREMRSKGLRRAQTFSWERTARETLGVYRQVAARRKPEFARSR
ncbi:MAG: glycosyltransferase family 4 protein [Chloroflexi bacterium]|nr:glycosyltransferase family 4 protein [Chloroflexota bacterium]